MNGTADQPGVAGAAMTRRAAREDDLAAAKSLMYLADLLRVRLNEVSAAHQITPQQGHLLYLVGEGMSMRAIAERLGCDPSNVTGLADRLEERGLVERRRSAADRRVTELVRTPAGEEFLAGMEAALFAELPIYRGLDPAERRELQRLLGKVVSHHELG